MTYNITVARRQKWVGPSIPAPRGDRCPPSYRQRHYRSTELAGTGERIHVDDVVEVITGESPSSSTSQPRLAQVQSMWEDTLTAASKFRARWLMRACDLPRDALQRLLQSRGVSPLPKPGAAQVGDRQTDTKGHLNEVFLTSGTQDLELRMIRKAAAVKVKSGEHDISPAKGQGHIVPRLTHTFCPSSGDFSELSDGEGVLVRAKSRQADAMAASAITSLQGRGAFKRGSNADGWLLQKGRSLATRGRGRGRGRGGGRGRFDGRTRSATISGGRSQTAASAHARQIFERSETSVDPMDEAWEEGDDGISDSDSDAGFPSNYRSALTPQNVVPAEKKTDLKVASKPCKPQRSSGTVQNEPTMSSNVEDVDTSQTSPTNGPQMPRRPRAPAIRRQGPLPPRPRRLAVPPAMIQTPPKGAGNGCPVNRASTLCGSQAASPMRTRFGTVGKDRVSPTRTSAQAKEAETEPLTHVNGKRKRAAPAPADEAVSTESLGYPPRRTPVGDEYQADIPDLLPGETRRPLLLLGEKRRPLLPKEDGAQMVWRSARDWDPRARASLDEYVRAVKKMLEAKQTRPGVGVHVRFRGPSNNTTGGDESEEKQVPSDNTGSHAMWAVTTGRNTAGDIRVGCSERTQTEIPRSAIQRVSCEEEALTGFVKAGCPLNNFTPALQMFEDSGTPESIQSWTFTQVRALEKSLEREFDPERHVLDFGKPGVKMDREDFIDLAKVSKSVPGKAPREVLAFYYKYLCTAAPLTGTDAPYGKEASATQRKGLLLRLEPTRTLSDSCPSDGAEANRSASPPSRGPASPQASRIRTPPPPPGSNATPSTPDTENKITRAPVDVPSPDASERPSVDNDKSITGAPAPEKASVPKNGVAAVRNSSLSQDVRRDERQARLSSDQPCENRNSSATLFANKEGLKQSPMKASREKDEEARDKVPRREIEGCFTRPKPMPPGTEVLEVVDDDSDDERARGRGDLSLEGRRHSNPLPQQASPTPDWRPLSAPDGWAGGRPSGGTVQNVGGSRHPTSATAPVRPLSVRTTVEHTRQSTSLGYPRAGHAFPAMSYAYSDERYKERYLRHHASGGPYGDDQYQRDLRRREERVGSSSVEGWAPRTHSDPSYRVDDDVGNGSCRGGGADSASVGAVRVSYDPATVEAKFGLLAPCWRLLEKARAYLEENQLRYMSGLIQAHLKKPMTRDQLLERAKSCLEEQVQIFNAFVKMFDRIEKPLAVPFYPSAKRKNGSTTPVASPSPSPHGAVPISNAATQRQQEGNLPAFNTSPSLPARGRAPSGVGFRLSHPPPDCGAVGVDRGISRAFRRSSEPEERAPSVSAHEQSGTNHPRSVIPHTRSASGNDWCSSSGGGRTESPVYRSRSPPQQVVSYGGGINTSTGKVTSGYMFSAKHVVPRSGESRYTIPVPRPEPHRPNWGPTVRKDCGTSGVLSSSVSGVMAGEAGIATGPCEIGALRALPDLRPEPERELLWRNNVVQEPRSVPAMTTLATLSTLATLAEVPVERKGFASGRTHWGFRDGLKSWR